ncbi:type-F conjugative transfer system secretin TraK [Kordiimonas aquimaris]|uniref:type-F conjugative transfer system secretin TraK n=1 Tax=Kordiimonas aquimaris TaxID=707591 RepID=UPI0021D274B2|nr:type-F conjugative transfer system secretin TraK [Kordiimonas aquimaris]
MSKLLVRHALKLALAFGLSAGPAAASSAQSPQQADAPQTSAPHQTVLPGNPTAVVLSNRDTNRIVCVAGQIGGYRFSEEKGAIVDGSGNEAFIKFQIERFGEDQKYVNIRSEFYFQCAGVTYTLLSAPGDIAAQTVYLVPGSGQDEKANRMTFKALSEEERAVTMTLSILKDDIPVSFTTKPSAEPYNQHVLKRVDVRLVKEVAAVGTGYSAREYLLRARSDVALAERDFLKPFFGASIYAVTLDRLNLKAGEVGRVVFVYRGEPS